MSTSGTLMSIQVRLGFGLRCWNPVLRRVFLDLHHDDAMWAYALRASEWMRTCGAERILDPTLRRLIYLGINDWAAPNERLNQSAQAIRHGTAIAMRLLPMILNEQTRVSRLKKCSWLNYFSICFCRPTIWNEGRMRLKQGLKNSSEVGTRFLGNFETTYPL